MTILELQAADETKSCIVMSSSIDVRHPGLHLAARKHPTAPGFTWNDGFRSPDGQPLLEADRNPRGGKIRTDAEEVDPQSSSILTSQFMAATLAAATDLANIIGTAIVGELACAGRSPGSWIR